ncbi:serine/arginine repetitive matrix protein 1-like isoform X5 [Dermacentor silvarum]|uniref:serine/arginine repetitive matrix protein 1-like isoform X4 n=1 Tax=Dermacentor silvarum TaxID=543639 RepID=UPI00210096AA|nr:serine/arginine repetitive matrix protein 1-like isoform X4 [Dermacentor silvarum]XP_049511866.1 serine/arginine repetitive matrix protein 1-like isoform X5 [Dermacentor silvarum]
MAQVFRLKTLFVRGLFYFLITLAHVSTHTLPGKLEGNHKSYSERQGTSVNHQSKSSPQGGLSRPPRPPPPQFGARQRGSSGNNATKPAPGARREAPPRPPPPKFKSPNKISVGYSQKDSVARQKRTPPVRPPPANPSNRLRRSLSKTQTNRGTRPIPPPRPPPPNLGARLNAPQTGRRK